MNKELFNYNNYRTYNIRLAKCLNLSTAAYLSEILAHSVDDDIFNIDTNIIQENTSLSEEEQAVIKNNLITLKILDTVTLDTCKINFNIIDKLLEGNTSKCEKARKLTTTGGKLTARQKQCNALKDSLQCSNDELLLAYRDWIDGVYANPKGFLSYKAINIFKQTVDEFANGDLDLALKIIDIATVNGYRDATWAINVFKKDYERDWNKTHAQPVSMNEPKRKVLLSNEVF